MITTVDAVHIENFPSVDAIADAKAEIFLGFDPNGTAVLNRDNPHFERLGGGAMEAGSTASLRSAGRRQADVCLRSAKEDAGRHVEATLRHSARLPGRRHRLPLGHELPLCAGRVQALGADVARGGRRARRPAAAEGERAADPRRSAAGLLRADRRQLQCQPASMAASFQVLGRSRPGDGGRRIAVLGDMLELGDDAPACMPVSPGLLENGIDLVFTAGPMMEHLRAACRRR